MDSYLNIVSLALAIAALVPVLFPAGRVRFWTVTAGALALVFLLGIYRIFQDYSERRAVDAVKDEIWSVLTKKEEGMTFDEVNDALYYRDCVDLAKLRSRRFGDGT